MNKEQMVVGPIERNGMVVTAFANNGEEQLVIVCSWGQHGGAALAAMAATVDAGCRILKQPQLMSNGHDTVTEIRRIVVAWGGSESDAMRVAMQAQGGK